MKNLFKASILILLMFTFFACKETGHEIIEQQKNGSITTKYSSDRTTATTYLTGTITLPAGTYDIVDVAVGANVTLANGANMNQLVTHSGTTAIGTLAGSFVSIHQSATITYNVTFTNRGNLYGGDVHVNGGSFVNWGMHNPENLTIRDDGTYDIRLFGYLETIATIKFYRTGKMTLWGCNQVLCDHVQVEGFIPYTGFNFLYGKGSFKANTAYIENSQFVGDSTIKFCCPSITTFFGSTGNATLSCSTTCP